MGATYGRYTWRYCWPGRRTHWKVKRQPTKPPLSSSKDALVFFAYLPSSTSQPRDHRMGILEILPCTHQQKGCFGIRARLSADASLFPCLLPFLFDLGLVVSTPYFLYFPEPFSSSGKEIRFQCLSVLPSLRFRAEILGDHCHSLLCESRLLLSAAMRAPSLLTQCLSGLVAHDRGGHSITSIPEKDIHLPLPAVEILPSKAVHPYKYIGENADFQGVHFKGRVNIADIIGVSGSETVSSKPDGHLKSWDSSIDLVSVLKHEIRDGQLSFRGKRVLELGCNNGLPGIFACLKGASLVHFQDHNAETIRCTTIPNVLANLEQARDRQCRQPESPLTPSRQTLAPSVHFYAGDWEELPAVLSVVKNDGYEVTPAMSLSFSEEDFMDACSSQDGSVLGHETSSRRSRKLSGSRAWERANEEDQRESGYDVILMTEIPFSVSSTKKLYALIKKCLRPPYGVVYLATKKNYVGFNNGARHLRSLVDEEGIFGAHLIKDLSDRYIWKFFHK